MSPPLAPIGTSMIQFIDHDDDDDGGMSSAMDVVDVEMPSTSTRTTQPISPPPPPPPCLLLPHTDPSNPSPSILLQCLGSLSLSRHTIIIVVIIAILAWLAATLFLHEEESSFHYCVIRSYQERCEFGQGKRDIFQNEGESEPANPFLLLNTSMKLFKNKS